MGEIESWLAGKGENDGTSSGVLKPTGSEVARDMRRMAVFNTLSSKLGLDASTPDVSDSRPDGIDTGRDRAGGPGGESRAPAGRGEGCALGGANGSNTKASSAAVAAQGT